MNMMMEMRPSEESTIPGDKDLGQISGDAIIIRIIIIISIIIGWWRHSTNSHTPPLRQVSKIYEMYKINK